MKISELYKIYKSNSVVCTDTRKIKENSLFFALKGDNFNGNNFAKHALERGSAFAIIDEEKFKTSDKFILVEDVLNTLQQLANYHRKQLKIPFIGITGSNGKTTSKELISVVLSKKYKTSSTKGNFNNHIGVPITLLSIPNDCEIAIIEMGANHVGEIKFLCHICEPDFGIITNIGIAHIEGFGSREGVKKGKRELYQFIKENQGKIFINKADQTLMEIASGIDQYTYGLEKADNEAKLISSTPSVQIEWKGRTIHSNLYGSYNFNNILSAISIGNYFKVPAEDIKIAIEEYQSTNNRSQRVKIKDLTVYLDAYNANPTSMNAAIDTFAENNSVKKLMILGDMLELGNISQEEHQMIINKAHSLNIPSIFIGEEFNKSINKYNFIYLKDYQEVVDWFEINEIESSQILIKGSRGIGLERIVEYLQKKEAI